jgi:hypothetical protein
MGFLDFSLAAAQTKTANFSQGDRVMVVTKVNVRSNPNGSIVGKQTAGAFGTLVGGPSNANGYTWWNIKYDTGVSGWSAEDFLQKPAQSATTKQSALSALLDQMRSQGRVLASDIASVQKALQAAVAASQ